MPRFHPQVRREVATAIRHYDSISDALGDDFWAKFEQTCSQVDSHPPAPPDSLARTLISRDYAFDAFDAL